MGVSGLYTRWELMGCRVWEYMDLAEGSGLRGLRSVGLRAGDGRWAAEEVTAEGAKMRLRLEPHPPHGAEPQKPETLETCENPIRRNNSKPCKPTNAKPQPRLVVISI